MNLFIDSFRSRHKVGIFIVQSAVGPVSSKGLTNLAKLRNTTCLNATTSSTPPPPPPLLPSLAPVSKKTEICCGKIAEQHVPVKSGFLAGPKKQSDIPVSRRPFKFFWLSEIFCIKVQTRIFINIYLAGFLETYLPKFAAIRVERAKGSCFSTSLKITIAKEKERKKYRKREGRKEEKMTLSVFILATLEKKTAWRKRSILP